MNHRTVPKFWRHYHLLPAEIQELADKNFALLKENTLHPSLHFKRIEGPKQLWSVRVGSH